MCKFVSIIVPAYNAAWTLSECIESLLDIEYPKEFLEIIVINNNSTDETETIVKKYPVKFIFVKERSRSIARNIGIKASRGELIAFVDADCIVDKFWLKNLVQAMEQNHIGGCGGKIIPVPHSYMSLVDRCRIFKYTKDKLLPSIALFFPHISSANAIYQKEVLYNVDFFDESLSDLEDIDLCWRVFYQGYVIKYIPEAIVYEKFCPPSFIKYFVRYFQKGVSFQVLNRRWDIVTKKIRLISLKYCLNLYLSSLRSFIEGFISERKRVENFLYSLHTLSLLFGICWGWPYRFLSDKVCQNLKSLKESRYSEIGQRNFNLNREARFYFLDNCVKILNLNKLECFALENVEKRIIELILAGRKTENEIIEILVQEYDVDAREAKGALSEFIDELRQRNILNV